LENLKEYLYITKLDKLDKKQIESAIDKLPEVYAIVVKERLLNFK
jgi:hypothetical protein